MSKIKLPKINLANLEHFEEDNQGNILFSKADRTFRVQYQPKQNRFGWIPHQTGGGQKKSKSKSNRTRGNSNMDKLMYWLLLKGMNQQATALPVSQIGGVLPTEEEMQGICQQVTQMVNTFNNTEFREMEELEEAFRETVKKIFKIPKVNTCDIIENVRNDLNDIMERKEKKILTQRRQKQQQQPSEQEEFNETRRFGYYYGVYQGKEYSKLTFYHAYHCIKNKVQITFYGHINNENDVLEFMDQEFTTNLCDRLKAEDSKEETMNKLLTYLTSFVSQKKIKSVGSMVFYVNDYVYLVAINKNTIDTKIMGETAPVSMGIRKSKGRVKMRGFSKKEIPEHQTYNIIVGSRGFWRHNRPGFVESAWGLITGESNFEELIGKRDVQERQEICQKLVRRTAQRYPGEDIAVIFTEICGEPRK